MKIGPLSQRQRGDYFDLEKRQPQFLGGRAIVGNHVDQFRPRAGVLAEGCQPARPIGAIGLQLALVEDHDDRLFGLDRGAKKLLYGGVVVFLLGEDGHQHVGRLADGPRTMPVDCQVGIDVRCVQQQQSRRHRRPATPEEAVFRRIQERIVGRLPATEHEGPEQPL